MFSLITRKFAMRLRVLKYPPDLRLPEDHPFYEYFVFDTLVNEWYNIKTDIFLTDDDVAFHKLPTKEELCLKNQQKK